MAFDPRGMISRVRGMICRQQPICFTPCEYKIRQDLPYPMLFLLHGGKWRSDGCNLLPVPSAYSVLSAKLGIVCYAAKFLKALAGIVLYSLRQNGQGKQQNRVNLQSMPCFLCMQCQHSCRASPALHTYIPTYLHTYGLTDGRTTGRINYWTDRPLDGWTTGWPACLHTGRLSVPYYIY